MYPERPPLTPEDDEEFYRRARDSYEREIHISIPPELPPLTPEERQYREFQARIAKRNKINFLILLIVCSLVGFFSGMLFAG